MANATSIDPATRYRIQPSEDPNYCMTIFPEIPRGDEFPTRVVRCSNTDDYALWQLPSDGNGGYFMYNKGYPGTTKRFTFDQGSEYTPFMGPAGSGNDDRKPHWHITDAGSGAVQITNGEISLFLSQKSINTTDTAVVLTSASESESSLRNWVLSAVEPAPPIEDSTSNATSSASITNPSLPSAATPSNASGQGPSSPLPNGGGQHDLALGLGIGLGVPTLIALIVLVIFLYRRYRRVEAAAKAVKSDDDDDDDKDDDGYENDYIEKSAVAQPKLPSSSRSSFNSKANIEILSGKGAKVVGLIDTGSGYGNFISQHVVEEVDVWEQRCSLDEGHEAYGIGNQHVNILGVLKLQWKIAGCKESYVHEFNVVTDPHIDVLIGLRTSNELGLVKKGHSGVFPTFQAKKETKDDKAEKADAKKEQEKEAAALAERKKKDKEQKKAKEEKK
ncbi:hypothetical protein HD806DRAFT_547695 [Xylariaceae sp. AK1471]|nr:hypothetical protein HD806DRAFT_547695 [Xylariaceae sp. AK1471]